MKMWLAYTLAEMSAPRTWTETEKMGKPRQTAMTIVYELLRSHNCSRAGVFIDNAFCSPIIIY
eukprot:12925500-Prorocentrum_lima.AAC.1